MVYVPERVWIDRGRYLEAESNFFSGQVRQLIPFTLSLIVFPIQ